MKNNIKLAIHGGEKTIVQNGPHYVWPPISEITERNVVKQLHKSISIYDRSGIFKEFEEAFAFAHQRKFSLLCSSGTLAIHSMYVAAGFSFGDEVICPAYTFFATVTPLLHTGAKPILCDCDENGNIDPNEILKHITSKTKGVVVTHMWGVPCQMEKIVKICKEKDLLLLEDCSHAHGAKIDDKLVGSFGDLAAWSLQGPKNVSGGEGGIMVTNEEELYYKALLLGHYNKRCKQEIPKDHPLYKYSTTGMGLKYRAHPLAISIAYENFQNLDRYHKTRSRFAEKIMSEVDKLSGLKVPMYPSTVNPSWYGLVFQYDKAGLDNLPIETFYDALKAEGLYEVDRPGSTSPLNLLPLFNRPEELFPIYLKDHFSYKKGDFPTAELFFENAIKIPVWAQENDTAIVALYIKGIKKVIENYRELL
ncbi:MAG: aminotransferase class I/II-fold pyridoxal phosphate-dependent enzyme [Candidatus Taylorbacteria bacterium]